MKPPSSLFLLPLLAAMAAPATRAAEAPLSFNRDIRPLLSNSCLRCHGPDPDQRKGGPRGSHGLRLDTAEGALMDLGGKQAVVPGHPEQSELVARLRSHDPDELMPPPKAGKALSPADIALIEAWIRAGAHFTKHWSYEKPQRAAPPRLDVSPVDAFVLDRLQREGLAAQPEADPATLLRRATLDLTGLPPSPEAREAFLADTAPGAYERLVDRLLAAPAYGEHWARQWLDLARYADSAGYADDPFRPIWPFRDYVIRSFNENKPFDQFTLEQIAGDLLPNATEEQIVATAFHRNTMTNSEGGTNDEEFRNAAVVDRVNTTLGVWMGTSMACAQCHTHKYDPITHAEYFGLFAFLNSTDDADRRDESPLLSFYTGEQKAERLKLEGEMASLEAQFQSPSAEVQRAAAQWAQTLGEPLAWRPAVPSALKSQAGLALAPQADGTVSVAAAAAQDTYALEIPLAEAGSLTALRLEALPDANLPGQGPGHAGGNFVVTRVRATLRPPEPSAPLQARFLRIELPGKDKTLQLAEVQVFSGGVNIAPQGLATQSSTYDVAAASRANDGNAAPEYHHNSVAHTAPNTENPWWEVDLKSPQSIERIVVWNRAEVGERLAGFRVVALDAERRPLWEKADNAAAAQSAFSLTGDRDIPLAAAVADYQQPDFSVDSVLGEAAPPPRRGAAPASQKGWAIGGAPGQAHSLMLVLGAPLPYAAGATLVVTIEQQSPHPNHTLGRFRLSTSSDSRAAAWSTLPPELVKVFSAPPAPSGAAPPARALDYYAREIAPSLEPARLRLAAVRQQREAMPLTTVPIMKDLPPEHHRVTKVQLRGNWQALGEEVQPGVPAAFHPLPPDAPRNRLTLARWLVDPENPLTARVIANRYWEALFGIGLVRTSEEFGNQGDLPSHPELLDWLATELVREKWDLKKFLRLLLTSSTYRQSSKVAPGMAERDPDNRLLARGPRLRLSAEMVRDQALAVGGLLSPKMLGPSVKPARPNMGLSAAFGGGLDWQTSAGEDRFRRALYTEWRRTSPYPSLATFDAPSRETCTLRRNRTNTPLQALVALNDPVFVEAAQALARSLADPAAGPEEIIRRAFVRVLSRPPSDRERARLVKLQAEALATFRQAPERALQLATDPLGPLPPGAEAAELASWTAVANVLLNLDESLMKR